jgi:hypothetical protein
MTVFSAVVDAREEARRQLQTLREAIRIRREQRLAASHHPNFESAKRFRVLLRVRPKGQRFPIMLTNPYEGPLQRETVFDLPQIGAPWAWKGLNPGFLPEARAAIRDEIWA